jgi:hypothetical protein
MELVPIFGGALLFVDPHLVLAVHKDKNTRQSHRTILAKRTEIPHSLKYPKNLALLQPLPRLFPCYIEIGIYRPIKNSPHLYLNLRSILEFDSTP